MTTTLTYKEFAAIIKIGNAASKDIARPTLCNVYLEQNGAELTAVATDSYIIAKRTAVATYTEPWSAMVPARTLRVAATAIKQLEGIPLPDIELHVEDEYIAIESPKLLITVDRDEKAIPFPKAWRTLFANADGPDPIKKLARMTKSNLREYLKGFQRYPVPDASKADMVFAAEKLHTEWETRDSEVAVNPDILKQVLTTSALTPRHYGWVKIELFGKFRPVRYTSEADANWVALQMPIRP